MRFSWRTHSTITREWIALEWPLQKEKEAGNEAFKAGNYEEALRLYTQALARDPENKDVNSKLYNNRAAVLSKV